ncbi:MAG: hypothetical protein KGR68_03740 [Betaproteobacteria bacterium]|nr:hypothetical protein [Betaproteobacteria bacterium]
MATALDYIKRALRMIGELAAETGEAPNDAQATQALGVLNAMLAGWEHEGVPLGLPTLTLSGTVPVPPSHDDAIAYNLAVNCAAEWGQDAPQVVALRAVSTFAALQAIYANAPTMIAPPEYIIGGRALW